jgi:hypothetical protein
MLCIGDTGSDTTEKQQTAFAAQAAMRSTD